MIILLKILKIIAIVIVSLLILIVLLSLFSVNFALEINNKNKLNFNFKIDYLLNLIEFKISFLEKLKMTLRILFITINLNNKKKKDKNKVKNKDKNNNEKKDKKKQKNIKEIEQINKALKLSNNNKAVTYKDVKRFDKKLNKELEKDKDNISDSKPKKKSILAKYKELSKENQEYIKNYFINLLKEFIGLIKPKEFKVDTTFGLEDPYTVGTILSVLGILYVKFGDSINVRPVYNRNVFDGEIYIKGSFRLISVIIILIKAILDKKVREFLWKT